LTFVFRRSVAAERTRPGGLGVAVAMPVMRVSNSPNQELALTNCAFLSEADLGLLSSGPSVYVEIGAYVLTAKPDRRVEPGCVALNSVQRRMLNVSNGDASVVEVFTPEAADKAGLAAVTLEVDFVLRQRARGGEVDSTALAEALLQRFRLQYLTVDQIFVAEWQGDNLQLRVKALELIALDADAPTSATRGMLGSQTQVQLRPSDGSPIKLTGAAAEAGGKTNIFRSDWSFEAMGIGGLDQEFSDIFRRAFASRIFPVSTMQKLGISHVKGMMLHGPPGTGKTLIARQIGKMLNGKEPKVVNGPEVLSKFVGQAEENVRKLFAEAEAEYEVRRTLFLL
jgi:vesicle-fusing ATPase